MNTRLLTAREVAEHLGVSPDVLLRWVRASKIPAVKLPGGGIRFREEDLEEWLEEHSTEKRGRTEGDPSR